jgi:hypothetical protein
LATDGEKEVGLRRYFECLFLHVQDVEPCGLWTYVQRQEMGKRLANPAIYSPNPLNYVLEKLGVPAEPTAYFE